MKLKPCPFCGGEATTSHGVDDDTLEQFFFVSCEYCGSRTRKFHRYRYGEEYERKAIEAWNRREPIDKIVEQLEEQKDKHEKLGIEASKLCTFERLEARPIVFDEKMCHEKAVEVLDKAIEIVKGGSDE